MDACSWLEGSAPPSTVSKLPATVCGLVLTPRSRVQERFSSQIRVIARPRDCGASYLLSSSSSITVTRWILHPSKQMWRLRGAS